MLDEEIGAENDRITRGSTGMRRPTKGRQPNGDGADGFNAGSNADSNASSSGPGRRSVPQSRGLPQYQPRHQQVPPQQHQQQRQQQQLMRQRRRQITADLKRADDEMETIKRHLKRSADVENAQKAKAMMVAATALVVTIMAALFHIRPRFLYGSKNAIKPYHIATMYPPSVVLERDMPRFFRTFTIATPENREARRIASNLIRSRTNIRDGSIQVHVRTFDAPQVNRYLNHNLCGPEFREAYDKETDFARRQDLFMWCTLTMKLADGWFFHDLEILDSALILAKGRGVAAMRAPIPGADWRGLASNFFIMPRNNEVANARSVATLPSQMLTWVMSNELVNYPSEMVYQSSMERYLYRLVEHYGFDDYVMLDVVCNAIEYEEEHHSGGGDAQPRIKLRSQRAVARQCDSTQCCEYVVPDHYGGGFGGNKDDSSDD